MLTFDFKMYDLKVYEITALLLDIFINKKMFLQNHERFCDNINLDFDDFENIYKINPRRFEHEIQYSTNYSNEYKIRISTIKDSYHMFVSEVSLSIFVNNHHLENLKISYSSNYETISVKMSGLAYDYTTDEGKTIVSRKLTRIIDSIRKFEETLPVLDDHLLKFVEYNTSRLIDINLMSKLHKHKDVIKNYQINDEDKQELKDFMIEYIKEDQRYNLKTLTVMRQHDRFKFKLTHNALATIKLYNFDDYNSTLSIIIPIMKNDGGIPLFRRLITEERLRKE